MKERPDGEGWIDGAPPPLRYAVQGFAPLRRLENKCVGWEGVQEGIGKSAGAWHFSFRGKDKRWHE
jgi:hypothetical protein